VGMKRLYRNGRAGCTDCPQRRARSRGHVARSHALVCANTSDMVPVAGAHGGSRTPPRGFEGRRSFPAAIRLSPQRADGSTKTAIESKCDGMTGHDLREVRTRGIDERSHEVPARRAGRRFRRKALCGAQQREQQRRALGRPRRSAFEFLLDLRNPVITLDFGSAGA
jgi:hypothetical protein